ncbi:MAG: hypothetical protein JWQ27_1439 [Ferruginibacter sp.]|nr:hypothetical protein [Ferruginibacter sp.]
MNKILITFGILMGALVGCSHRFTSYQHEGIQSYSYTGFIREGQINKLWFKDSMIICAARAYRKEELNDSVIYEGYDLYKYSFLDLKTMRCQDYYNFSDTARPFTNYILHKEKGEAVGWGFYNDNSFENRADSLISLPDTTIDGSIFKRLKTVNMYKPFKDEYIIYFKCPAKQSMFSLDRRLEKKYPNCKIVRTDLVDSNAVIGATFEYAIERENLTANEEKIFRKWKENAATTKLPVISFKEVHQIPYFPHKEL